jgi:hypothetical protein
LSVSATCWIKALRSGWRTPVAILSWHTSQLRNADRMTTAPHTYPAMDSYRTLSCIITRSDIDSTNRITCDISRHIHHLSCRDANEITRRSSAHLQARMFKHRAVLFFSGYEWPPSKCVSQYQPAKQNEDERGHDVHGLGGKAVREAMSEVDDRSVGKHHAERCACPPQKLDPRNSDWVRT